VWSGQQVEVCIAWQRATTVDVSSMDALQAGLEAWRVADLIPLQNTGISAAQWVLTDLTSISSPSIIYPITADQAGTGSAFSVMNNVTLVTSFLTDKRGRSYRGRVYTPGLDQGGEDSPTSFDPAYVAALVTAWADMTTFVPAGWTHVVESKFNALAARTTAVLTPVTAYRSDVNADSQRRRLALRGS